MRVQGSTDDQSSVLDIWREAAAIIRGYPVATIVPAVVLGALAEAPYYFIDDSRPVLEKVLTSVGAALAFYLYVAYAEEVATEAERGANRITAFGVLGRLHQATPVALPVVVASVPAVLVPTAATGLLNTTRTLATDTLVAVCAGDQQRALRAASGLEAQQ